jgi:hypothetical protein
MKRIIYLQNSIDRNITNARITIAKPYIEKQGKHSICESVQRYEESCRLNMWFENIQQF